MEEKIISRIEEYGRKMEFLESRERQGRSRSLLRRWITISGAAAACAVILIAVLPLLRHSTGGDYNLTPPAFEQFRGGGATAIETAINAADYNRALALTEEALVESEKQIKVADDDAFDDEEAEYLISVEMEYNAELQWTRIWLLVKLDRLEEARKYCRQYVDMKVYAEHRDEAIDLMEK